MEDHGVSMLNLVNHTVNITSNIQAHLVQETIPGLPHGSLGSYGFKCKEINGYQTQYFYLTNNGELGTEIRVNEQELMVKFGSKIEKEFGDKGTRVIDIRLPTVHGFTGRKIIYNLLKFNG